jgi:hypothetical protein
MGSWYVSIIFRRYKTEYRLYRSTPSTMRKSGNQHQQYACIEMQGSVPAGSEFTPCPVAAGEYAAQDVSLTTPSEAYSVCSVCTRYRA